ncbi:hypothetical protein Pan241w_27700 [Gimesia alba]|uniref:Uncharacterized protein n=1 Tax=Gimesia alba TaxID=2527973 RepID=A0A517RFL8_9PLAN|nr:hypothetical protein [Gimesia alba]QDT42682.1 hypothetical protein Pan241w_27700 [Gimesia alba]
MPEINYRRWDCRYNWRVRFHRDGDLISVRIKLRPDSSISSHKIETLKEEWRRGILSKWNRSDDQRFRFKVEFVDHDEHYVVEVTPSVSRSHMKRWDQFDTGHVASHEFGHMIGLKDEYHYPFPECSLRSPVDTGTVMETPTGPVVDRLLSLVDDTEGDTPPARRPSDIRPLDIERPINIQLIVSGGFPEKKLHFETRLDESMRTAKSILSDMPNNQSRSIEREFDGDSVARLKDLLRSLILDDSAIDADSIPEILPDTPVGEITFKIGEKSHSVFYPMEELSTFGLPENPDYFQYRLRPRVDRVDLLEAHTLMSEINRRKQLESELPPPEPPTENNDRPIVVIINNYPDTKN